MASEDNARVKELRNALMTAMWVSDMESQWPTKTFDCHAEFIAEDLNAFLVRDVDGNEYEVSIQPL